MKKYFVSAALVAMIAACGGGSSSDATKDSAASTTTEPAAPASTDISENPDYKAGLALIGKSDCLTCHKVTERSIGPSYKEVAQKYAGQDTAIAYLSKKIIEGGSGVWGMPGQMTPHPQLAQADVEQMVKYVLLLKDAE